jgi:hypothetical protein
VTGNEARGTLRADGTRLVIFSAAAGAIVIADRETPAKADEIRGTGPMPRDLDARFPPAGLDPDGWR